MQKNAQWPSALHGSVRMVSLLRHWIRRSCPQRMPQWAIGLAGKIGMRAPTLTAPAVKIPRVEAPTGIDTAHAGRWAWASLPPSSWPSVWPGRCARCPTPRPRIVPKQIRRWPARHGNPNRLLNRPRAWVLRPNPLPLRHCLLKLTRPKQSQCEPVRMKTLPWLRMKTLPPLANRVHRPPLPKRGNACRSSKQA